MKIDAEIEWVIDDNMLGVQAGKIEHVPVDTDYVESDEGEITESIEDSLYKKYGTIVHASKKTSDNGDFVIKNMKSLIEDISCGSY